ncbi:MAG: twin-arginine translocation signal domain-containing protein, partial [Sediminibacterium sp.]
MEPKDISRRKFIRAAGLSATALTLGFYFSGESKASTIIKG